MAQDHYVAQTYLKHFTGPTGMLHAYRKSDGRSFQCRPKDVCREADGDVIPDFLSEPEYLGEFRGAFEPLWNGSVAALESRSGDMRDKLHMAGYWANLLVCTPAWRRVAVEASDRRMAHTVRAYNDISMKSARRIRGGRMRSKPRSAETFGSKQNPISSGRRLHGAS